MSNFEFNEECQSPLDKFAAQILDKFDIADRIRELSKEITRELRDEPVSFFWIANGAVHFYSDLSREVDLRGRASLAEPIRARSYHNIGQRRPVEHDIDELNLDKHRGRRIYLLDDVRDTSATLYALRTRLESRLPGAIIKTVVFIDKVGCQTHEVPLDFCGFRVYDKPWLTGYGMDTYERWRDVPGVWASVAEPFNDGFRPVKPPPDAMPTVCVGTTEMVLDEWRRLQKRRKKR